MRVALPRRRRVVVGAVLVSVVMGFQGSFTLQSYIGISAISLVAWWFGLVRPPPGLPAPRRLPTSGIIAWSIPVLAFSALEIVDDALGSSTAHPTLSSLFDPIFEIPAARAAGVALWLYAGWQLVRR
jgi:hypothetical protein